MKILYAHYNSFQRYVLPVLNEIGVMVLGMKSLAGRNARISRKLNVPVNLCRKYTFSLSVSSVIFGMQSPEVLRVRIWLWHVILSPLIRTRSMNCL
jgi:hypothetical protein